jgi:hypothetical protein
MKVAMILSFSLYFSLICLRFVFSSVALLRSAIGLTYAFQVAFLKREEPLGLHSQAIEHILTTRRELNISSYAAFSLYRMAHHRLQSRQLIAGSGPLPVQLESIEFLNLSDASIDLGAVLLGVQDVLRLAQKLHNIDKSDSANVEEHALALLPRIKSALVDLESWFNRAPASWHPRYLQTSEHEGVRQLLESASLPLIPQVRLYHDPWVAYQMNFYFQSQLVLHSALLETLVGIVQTTSRIDRKEAMRQELETQEQNVAAPSDALVQSLPMLIASSVNPVPDIDACQKKKIGQCFAQAACWTLQQVQHVPLDDKEFANRVVTWLQQQSSLD